LLVLAIVVVLLPLVELGDHWESYGSDPEFVNVITVAAICLGFLLFRREIVLALRRLALPASIAAHLPSQFHPLWGLVQVRLPDIRAPIRI
jgi:hypothetical protein